MNKTTITLALVFGCALAAFAQTSDGYVVHTNGDTLRGNVKVARSVDNWVASLDQKQYAASELLAFFDARKGAFYVRKANNEIEGREPFMFLQELVTGPLRLYRMPSSGDARYQFFVESDTLGLVELSSQYKGQLGLIMKSCEKVLPDVQRLRELRSAQLSTLVGKFNQCNGGESEVRAGWKSKMAIGILAGANRINANLNVSFVDQELSRRGGEREDLLRPLFGLEFQIQPFATSRWRLGARYIRRSFKDNYRFLDEFTTTAVERQADEQWNQDLVYSLANFSFNPTNNSLFLELGFGIGLTRYKGTFTNTVTGNGVAPSTTGGGNDDLQTTLAITSGLGYRWKDLKIGAYYERVQDGRSIVIKETSLLSLQVTYFLLKN